MPPGFPGAHLAPQVVTTKGGGIQGELAVRPGAVHPTVQAVKRLLDDYQDRGLP